MAKKATAKTEQKEYIPYRAAIDIYHYFGMIKCKVETPNDINLIASRQKMLEEMYKGYINKVLQTPTPEDATPEQVEAIREGRANDLFKENSPLTKQDVQFYTYEEFIYGIKDIELNNKEIGFLSFWLVKQDATK